MDGSVERMSIEEALADNNERNARHYEERSKRLKVSASVSRVALEDIGPDFLARVSSYVGFEVTLDDVVRGVAATDLAAKETSSKAFWMHQRTAWLRENGI